MLAIATLTLSCGGDGTTSDPHDIGDTHSDKDGQTSDTDTTDSHAEDGTLPPPPCTVGLPCSDNDSCTINDTCTDTVCAGTPYTCDDDRPCTANECDGVGGCVFPVTSGHCLIFNVCRTHGDLNSANTCERCDIDLNKIGWSDRSDDAPCEDGNPCTFGDYCKKGTCKKGLKSTCDDQNDCTVDSCQATVGCINAPASGSCDDGNPCTPESVCTGGVCHSIAEDCDDDNPCTTDTCLPDLGCAHVAFQGACEDGDACTDEDTCVESTCVPGAPTFCSDDTECTDDHCDAVFGCYHTLVESACCSGAVHLCDDGNPCTNDSCNTTTFACNNTPHTDYCDDGNPCTVDDACNNAVCEAGFANDCNDGNPCTTDFCDESVGCQNPQFIGPCDDGIECTVDETCIDGQCVGDSSNCKCVPDFGTTVARANMLLLGEDGEPGNGLDVDQNPATCAPVGMCSNGIDNALSPLAPLANPALLDAMGSGDVNLLFELIDPKTNGQPFSLALYAADLVGSGCDPMVDECNFEIDDQALSESCEALILLDNATIQNGVLTAGGPAYNFPLNVPLFNNEPFLLQLHYGTVRADITLLGNKVVAMTNGIIAGAVPKEIFSTALEMIDENDLPLPKETVVQLIDLILKEDVDTKPPAGPDAVSTGFRFTAIPAKIVGVEE